MLVSSLIKQSGVSEENLRWLASTASKRYKIYEISKRNGGTRTIAHPSRQIKAIQRWINRYLFKKLPVHSCATAYSPGSSIRKNAIPHANTKFTLRLDFKDFFPSFRQDGIINYLEFARDQHGVELNVGDIDFLSKIICRYERLTIGAPSSPIITNAMMFGFDEKLFNICNQKGLIYTRYADDIFISAPNKIEFGEIEERIKELVADFPFANLSINSDKTAYLSKRHRRTITGLVITTDNRVSLGRSRKREIKSLIFQHSNGYLDVKRIDELRGLISFARDSDPQFYASLVAKYGFGVLAAISKTQSP